MRICLSPRGSAPAQAPPLLRLLSRSLSRRLWQRSRWPVWPRGAMPQRWWHSGANECGGVELLRSSAARVRVSQAVACSGPTSPPTKPAAFDAADAKTGKARVSVIGERERANCSWHGTYRQLPSAKLYRLLGSRRRQRACRAGDTHSDGWLGLLLGNGLHRRQGLAAGCHRSHSTALGRQYDELGRCLGRWLLRGGAGTLGRRGGAVSRRRAWLLGTLPLPVLCRRARWRRRQWGRGGRGGFALQQRLVATRYKRRWRHCGREQQVRHHDLGQRAGANHALKVVIGGGVLVCRRIQAGGEAQCWSCNRAQHARLVGRGARERRWQRDGRSRRCRMCSQPCHRDARHRRAQYAGIMDAKDGAGAERVHRWTA